MVHAADGGDRIRTINAAWLGLLALRRGLLKIYLKKDPDAGPQTRRKHQGCASGVVFYVGPQARV